MKKNAFIFAFACSLAACAASRPEVRLTSEPSIERAFDVLARTRQGGQLLKFLYKNPVRFEYSNSAGNCHKFSLNKGLIFLPLEMKGSDHVLALALARAAHVYRLYALTGLDELISEEEELAALFQAHLALDMNLAGGEFEKAENAAKMKKDFCTYIMNPSRYTMAQARKEALGFDPDCQRPLETLTAQQTWLGKIRQAMNEDNFPQLLSERDQQRVRKGMMTMSEAMKNDARVRAMPSYETYRFQRTFYDDQRDIFSSFEKIYKREVAEDEAWRRAHKEEIDRARAEFSDCGLN